VFKSVVASVHDHAARTGSMEWRCVPCADRSRAAADDLAACAAERALLAGVLWPLDTMVKRRCLTTMSAKPNIIILQHLLTIHKIYLLGIGIGLWLGLGLGYKYHRANAKSRVDSLHARVLIGCRQAR